MNRDTGSHDFIMLIFIICGMAVMIALSGCATLKDTAKYREAQREKCACPQVWGESW